MKNEDFDQLLANVRVPRAPGEGILAYADGGPVLSDEDFQSQGGQVLSDADFQKQGGQVVGDDNGTLSDQDFQSQGGQVLSDDDFARMGGTVDDGKQYSATETAIRHGAHAVLPGAAAMAAIPYGAAAGAPLGPVGAFVGGAVAAGLAGYAANKAQEGILDATGLNDTEAREQ